MTDMFTIAGSDFMKEQQRQYCKYMEGMVNTLALTKPSIYVIETGNTKESFLQEAIDELYHHGGCKRAIDYLQQKLTTMQLKQGLKP